MLNSLLVCPIYFVLQPGTSRWYTPHLLNSFMLIYIVGTALAQWLRCCATNRKVAGSISDGVIGIFH